MPDTLGSNTVVAVRPLLTAVEVGKLLGVSAKTVRRLPIPCVPVGRLKRYRSDAVARWIEERETA